MKKYMVFAIAPAVAEITVLGENKADAINRVKRMIETGSGADFNMDINDSDDVEFTVLELDPEKDAGENTAKPGLKSYIVEMLASSRKEVPIRAVSPEAAEAIAQEMYCASDMIDFSDADVISVMFSAVPDDATENKADDLFMTELVKRIRSTDAPDEVLGHMLNRAVREVYGGKNGKN